MNAFVNFAKKAYDKYPGLAKRLGVFDLLTLPLTGHIT